VVAGLVGGLPEPGRQLQRPLVEVARAIRNEPMKSSIASGYRPWADHQTGASVRRSARYLAWSGNVTDPDR
jgi:hypothetical protein